MFNLGPGLYIIFQIKIKFQIKELIGILIKKLFRLIRSDDSVTIEVQEVEFLPSGRALSAPWKALARLHHLPGQPGVGQVVVAGHRRHHGVQQAGQAVEEKNKLEHDLTGAVTVLGTLRVAVRTEDFIVRETRPSQALAVIVMMSTYIYLLG